MAQVFQSRLKLLQEDLTTLQKRLTTLSVPLENSDEWRVSQTELSRQARIKLLVIKNLLAGPVDWSEFNQIRDGVTQINQEILEIVQGLAMRGADTDEICCVIVRRFLGGIGQDDLGLTVFTARDLNIPTLARLTRLRFPVKSIWTLPLAAHQYANLKIGSTPALRALAEDAAAAEVKQLETAPEKAAIKRLEAEAYSRWVQIMSDGLAVYFAGPCYAGSAILLRLSPATPDVFDCLMANDAERAFVILEMLRQIGGDPQDKESSYGRFILWLENQWTDMLAQAETAKPSQQRRNELADFVKSLISAADETVGYGRYSLEPPEVAIQASWSTAASWSYELETNLTRGQPLRVTRQPPNRLSDVRDALNAGWLCWSKADDPEKSAVIATAVLDLCKAIVKPPDEPPQPPELSTRLSTRAK